jgi:phosphonate transport system ATP-binding protein
VLTFERVTARYGSRTALESVSFALRPGERVALVGPSGAGKTTIFRLAYGAFAPSAGRVTIDGIDLARIHGARLRATRARIAVIFQTHGVVDRLAVWQNVLAGTFGRRGTFDSVRSMLAPTSAERALAADALGRVGLADRYASKTFELSGGQRQRVAIARAIAQRADLVLADEPAASLDYALASDIVSGLLADARERNATLLCSLHQPDLAERFDRVIHVAGASASDRGAAI